MKKRIDPDTARKLCAGCVYRRDLNPRCANCFVQILGNWAALNRAAEAQPGSCPDGRAGERDEDGEADDRAE